MIDSKLTFPVFTVTADGIAYAVENVKRLKVCTLKALKSGYYEHLIIYDGSLNKIEVLNAKKISVIWSIPEILFLNPFINIKLQFSNTLEQYDIEALKSILLRNIETSSYWKNIGIYQKVKKSIETATTFDDLYKSYQTH